MVSDQQQKQQRLSKRQRRAQGSNPSTTWQQQPRIKSAGARAKAYISYAGLADDEPSPASSSSSSKKKLAEMLDPQLDLHSPEVKFGRALGGTDQRSRHAAVKMLREYLRARSDHTAGGKGLSELDLLKLWKGLWYTLFMADKVPVQDKLSKMLAELMWCVCGTEEEDEYAGQLYLQMENADEEDYAGEEEDDDEEEGIMIDEDGDTMQIIEMDDDEENTDEADEDDEDEEEDMEEENDEEDEDDEEERRVRDMNETHCRGAHLVSLFLSTFLQTVRREWGNVDKHRVDKFYTAIRFMISEAYKYMSKRHWNLGIIRLLNDVIYNECLCSGTPGLTNGLRYHLIDICVHELARVNSKDAQRPLTEATFLDCLEPFFALAQKAVDKTVQKRVMDNVFLKFLKEYSFVSATALDEDADEDGKALIFMQVHVETVSKLIFEIASDANTDERFRKSLYDMHKMYIRQIRAAGRDVDLGASVGSDDDEEMDDCCANNTCASNAACGGAQGNDNDDDDESPEEMIASDDKDGSEEKDSEADTQEEAVAETEAEAPKSEKKKKRKKKKKNADKESEADAAPETPKSAEEDTVEATTPKSKAKKEKRQEAKEEEANDGVADEKGESAATKSTSSSKKKRKKQEAEPAEDNSDLITSHVETPKADSKKKKKKQKTASPPSVDPRAMHSPDQVLSPPNSDDEVAPSVSKRVSFGTMNHCKSYKASMKAMKTLDKERWDTANRTPDKGILRPKIALGSSVKKSSQGKKKKGKKHA